MSLGGRNMSNNQLRSHTLDNQGKRLLALLVSKLEMAIPNRPETYITYKKVHEQLNLPLLGTYGTSLQKQGLNSLAEWAFSTGKPGITGIVIDQDKKIPGKGYFILFGKTQDDFQWWKNEIQKSKDFDWSPYLPNAEPPPPPMAIDIQELPGRVEITTHRIIRDTPLARRIKQIHNYECQLCGHTIELANESRYAEAHHIQPLGEPHNGPDILENIVCLCPNHHAEMDYGARSLNLSQLRLVSGHTLAETYINYHNKYIFKKV